MSAERGERLADVGGIEAGLAANSEQALIAGEVFQHADQEPWLCAAARISAGPMPVVARKRPNRSPSPAIKVSA